MATENKGKKAIWGEVTCEKHGREMAGNAWKPKQVKVPVPHNKREKYTIGCPQCKMEAARGDLIN